MQPAFDKEQADRLSLSFAKTPQGRKSCPCNKVTDLSNVLHFKRILDFGEGQALAKDRFPRTPEMAPEVEALVPSRNSLLDHAVPHVLRTPCCSLN